MKKSKKVKLLTELSESFVKDSADLYLLFVDLCGSTEYKYTFVKNDLPDTVWIQRQLTFLNRVAEIIARYDGIVVKTVGDEVIGSFHATADPSLVLRCAMDAVTSCRNLKSYTGRSRIESKASIDLGLTYNGSVIDHSPYDPIGTPVDRCARLNGIAGRNEIVMSDSYWESMVDFYAKDGKKPILKPSLHKKNLKGLGKVNYRRLVLK
jgi:class 3 adenylate cyclase